MKKVRRCQNCGVFVTSIKRGVTIIKVKKDWIKRHPYSAIEVYLCPKDKCANQMKDIVNYEWYSSHVVIGE